MAVKLKTQGVETLARANRAAAQVTTELEASASAITSWSALMRELLRLSIDDPQSSLAIFSATERLVRSMPARVAAEFDEDDADAFGAKADAADQARIATAAERIASGDLPTAPYEVVKRIAEGTHRIRAWREYRGMTQAEVAARAALTQGAIADIERGRRSPSMDALRGIAAALDAHPSFLMD